MNIPTHLQSLGSTDLLLAARAAQAGGRVIAGYGMIHSVKEKGVGDLVLGVDTDSEEAILGVIRTQYRGNIICEESGPDNDGDWIVDPLDATSSLLFQTDVRHPSVLIAHQTKRVTDVAVVFLPLTGEWFYALKGKGAFKGNGERLIAKGTPILHQAWIDMNQYGDASFESAVFATLRTKLRSKDGARLVTSQVPHSAVAMRILDGTTGLTAVIHDNNPAKVKQAVWDVAAVKLIVEEADGVVVSFKGEPYDMFKPEPFIIATTNLLADEIIQLAY